MAGMKFTADIDVEGIIKLRQEINKLKNSLKAVAGIPNSDAAIKQLEKEIEAATKKLEEYENKYLQIQKLKHDIDSSNDAVKKAKKETAALQYTNKWIVANTEAVIETDKQIKQLKKSFVSLSDSEKTGSSGTGILRQVQQLAAQRLVEEESIRRTIKAQKDQIIQSRAEEGSITALRKQIILLTKDYDDLGRTRRNGDAGKALLAQIANVQKELSAAEQASGRFQRNVGNYASAWNGLSFSVQQVARELPSLAVSANTFFLAISNNLPILVDEIAKARKEYAAFKAEIAAGNKDVKAVAPVWQQLTKSLISWQTALVVGLTLLSVYGKEIISWISSLGKTAKAIKNLYTVQRDLYNVTSAGIEQSSKEITKLNSLYKIATDVTKSTKERNNAVKELKKSYPEHLKNLSDEKIKNGEVSKAIKEQTSQIVANAKATAAADQIAKNWYKSFQAGVSKNIAYITKQRLEQELAAKEASVQQLSQMRARPESYVGLSKEIEGIKDKIKETDREIKAQENLQDSYQKSSNALEKLVTVSGLGGKYEDPDKNYNSIIDQQKKINDLLDKQAIERRRKEEDLENQAFQARINTMADGEAKIRAQRALDNKKEIQDLKRQREDYIRTEIEYQKKVFDEQEELKAQKTKGYKKKTFDPTSVSVDTSALDSINQDTLKGQANDVAKYYKEVLSKYQDYTTKRLNAEKRFNRDREKLEKSGASDAQLNELEYQRTETLNSIDQEFAMREESFQSWANSIADLSLKELQRLLAEAERELERTEFLTPGSEGLATQRAKVNALKQQIGKANKNTTSPDKRSEKEWKSLYKVLSKVEEEFDKIGNTVGGTAGEILSAAGSITSSTLQMIDGITLLAESSAKAMEGTAKAASSAITTVEKASVVLAIIGAALQVATKITSLFDDSEAQQKRYEEYQRRQEGYWQAINYQTERYLELLKEAAANDYFEIAGKSLTTLEDARKKAYEDIIKSMPVGDVDHTTLGLVQLFNHGKFLDFRQYPDAKEIFDFINANGGYDLDNKLISEEAIWAMKNNADIWSKLPDWMQQAIDKFVELNDQAKDLEETLNKDLFQATSQSIEEAILEGLKGGKRGIADFGEDFEEIMRNALLQSFVIDQLRGKAQEFYKKYTLLADSDNNGKLDLTAEEISDLRKDWNDIIRAATEEAKNIDAIVGGSSSSSQESSKKGFATMSQDSADELNGRFTALQIAGEEIKNQNQLQTMSILDLKAGMLSIGANTSGIKDIAGETRDLIRLSYEAITDIRDNTNVMVKPIQQMAADIAEVKRNTNGLSKK
jgi:hypothetical protein|nr:MAG TPA: tail tape measure protein [Caudoviricetes sp.]